MTGIDAAIAYLRDLESQLTEALRWQLENRGRWYACEQWDWSDIDRLRDVRAAIAAVQDVERRARVAGMREAIALIPVAVMVVRNPLIEAIEGRIAELEAGR
jgi:hypothetical protein